MSLGDARTEPGIFRDTVGQLPNIKLKLFDVHFAALRVGLAQAGANCIMLLPSNKASHLQLWKKISEPAMRLAMDCARRSHFIMISPAHNEFGCGYCKRAGGPAELQAFCEGINDKNSTP